jgi:hypothetical protein
MGFQSDWRQEACPHGAKRGILADSAPALRRGGINMPSKVSGISIAALVGVALASSPVFAMGWSLSFDAPIHTVQYYPQKKKNLKKPKVLPPNPCRKQVCPRPRPR